MHDVNVFSEDFDRPGDTLVVTFGGIAQGMGIPPFEFEKITAALPARLLFVRDPEQAWYHISAATSGFALADIARRVAESRDRAGVRRLVCVGNSMGGYAALVVGSMLAADQVLSFAPQTFLTTRLRLRHMDRRWRAQMRRARRSPTAWPAAFDLATFLRAPGFASATVYSDTADRLDAVHARHIEDVPGLKIVWSEGKHALIRTLRATGELERVLHAACAG